LGNKDFRLIGTANFQTCFVARVETFLPGIAAYLSEPKSQAYFDGTINDLSAKEFQHRLSKQSLRPHPQTRLIALGPQIYCNGEEVTSGQTGKTQKAWQSLAAKKEFKGAIGEIVANNSLFEAFEAGWLVF